MVETFPQTTSRSSAAGGAIGSQDERYRYLLWRHLNREPLYVESTRSILWVLLNPSTADEVADDPTIRRCIAFSSAWGFHEMELCNLFALRSTDPRGLRSAEDPVGPENDTHIHLALGRADLVVVGWGIHGAYRKRQDEFAARYARCEKIHCLGRNRDGSPRHPLYIHSSAKPVPWMG